MASNTEKREALRALLEKRGYEVQEAKDLKHAVQLVAQRTYAAVICDQRLSDGDGVQFLHWLRREVFTMPFLLLTELLLPGLKQRWDFDFLVAPIDPGTLYEALVHLLGDEPQVVARISSNRTEILTTVASA